MSQELVYTSVPRGLLPGSSGFCTVARTVEMPEVLAKRLESLSGYRHAYPPQSENASLNPVAFSHAFFRLGEITLHLLSRIGSAGLDHTKRSNSIAHHVVLSPGELTACGPARILTEPNFMISKWDSPPLAWEKGRPVPNPPNEPRKCVLWEAITGDAGWGGILAETAAQKRPVCILSRPGIDLLPLFAESLALLPEAVRWNVTFNTHLNEIASGLACQWRGLSHDSPEAFSVRGIKGVLIIDLTKREPCPDSDSPLLELARTGRVRPPRPEIQPKRTDMPPSVGGPPTESPPAETAVGDAPPVIEPPEDGVTFSIATSPVSGRRRLNFGTWSERYESPLLRAEKNRKSRQSFFALLILACLAIAVLLTLLGDQIFNAGNGRKNLVQAFGSAFGAKTEQPPEAPAVPTVPERQPPPAEPNRKGTASSEKSEAVSGQEGSPTDSQKTPPFEPTAQTENVEPTISEKTSTPSDDTLSKTDGRSLESDEEARKKKEEKEAAKREELRRRRQEAMHAAFSSLPSTIPLKEPRKNAFDLLEYFKTLEPGFAPLYPYRDLLQLEWVGLAPPKGWSYRLEPLAFEWGNDSSPTAWQLFARKDIREFLLCSLVLSESGLEFLWDEKAAENAELSFGVLSRTPFSLLRVVLDPREDIGETAQAGSSPPAQRTVRVREIPLFSPLREKPFLLQPKTNLDKPANPVVKIDNVFFKDRWRVQRDVSDLQESLLLEISVEPAAAENGVVAVCADCEEPWKKTITFSGETLSAEGEPVTIPISAELTPLFLQFRDFSHEQFAQLAAQRRGLDKAKKEKEEASDKPAAEGEASPGTGEDRDKIDPKKRLQFELEDIDREYRAVDDLYQKIPVFRKKVFEGRFTIHFSISLRGADSQRLLLMTTKPQ